MNEIKKTAENLSDYIKNFRHDIHRHPELGHKEFRTTDKICEELTQIGLEPIRYDPTGVSVDIRGTAGAGDRTVVLRADIDALPMEESATHTCRSEVNGVMHACGHDAHLSMLLGAAHILNTHRNKFSGTVRCLFQPAEELSTGAKQMIEQGACRGADMFFGMHTAACRPTGEISTAVGAVGAAVSRFKITVNGKSAHGSTPENGIDAGLIAAQIYCSLQTIVSRRAKPQDCAVVSIGLINAGTAFNNIPGTAVLEGNCRYYNTDLSEKLPEWIEEVAVNCAKAYGGTASLEYTLLDPPTINAELPVQIINLCAAELTDDKSLIRRVEPVMASEDFAWYTELAPSGYINIGSGEQGGLAHTPEFLVDDDCLAKGAAMYSSCAIKALNELND